MQQSIEKTGFPLSLRYKTNSERPLSKVDTSQKQRETTKSNDAIITFLSAFRKKP
jgi:hypothetical protein